MGRRSSQTILGVVLSGVGTFSLSVGLSRTPGLPRILGQEGWVLATVEGFVLLLCGILMIAFAFRGTPEAAGILPATVAFSQRMNVPQATADAPTSSGRGHAAAPATDPRSRALLDLDEEVRELTRRINKAGVLLATGQLSDQGYVQYVDDLKRRRAEVEARRVRIELGQL